MNKLHLLFLTLLISCNSPNCDIVIHNGTIIDGTGSPRFKGTVAIASDKVVYVGPKKKFSAKKTIEGLENHDSSLIENDDNHKDKKMGKKGWWDR